MNMDLFYFILSDKYLHKITTLKFLYNVLWSRSIHQGNHSAVVLNSQSPE